MNVVVVIEGREAIPVRAIPLLTDWEVLSPDELAQALTGEDEFSRSFRDLTAYRLVGGVAVSQRWWANGPVRKLQALTERIKHTEITHEIGYDQWKSESLPLLPDGVYLWRDEFERCFWHKFGPDGETEWVLTEGGSTRRPKKEFIELDFDPFIQDPEVGRMVMEGFKPQAATSNPVPVPVVAESASAGVDTVNGPDWVLARPSRFPGYRKPLYDLLKAAQIAQKPRPTAYDVLDEWKIRKPAGIVEVLDGEMKFEDSKGKQCTANTEAIRKAIDRMTT